MSMDDFEVLDQPLEKEQSGQIDFSKFLKGIWRRKWIILALGCISAIPFYFIAKNQVPMYKCQVVIQSKTIGEDENPIFDGVTQAEIRSQSFTERMACVLGLAFANSESVYDDFDDIFLKHLGFLTERPLEVSTRVLVDSSDISRIPPKARLGSFWNILLGPMPDCVLHIFREHQK